MMAAFCEIDGRVLGGTQFGGAGAGVGGAVWGAVGGAGSIFARLMAGCCLGRALLEVLVCNHCPVFRCLGSMLVYVFLGEVFFGP